MTVTTIYATSTGTTSVYNQSGTWEAARTASTGTSTLAGRIGMYTGSPFEIYQVMLSFAVSSITDTVSNVTFSWRSSTFSGTSMLDPAVLDGGWGASLDTGDYLSASEASTKTELTRVPAFTTSSQWKTSPSSSNFCTYIENATTAYITVVPYEIYSGTTPSSCYSNIEIPNGTYPPYLTITHAPSFVSQSMAAQWDVDALVSKATAAQWNIDALTSRAVAAQWDVMQLSGTQDVSALWDVTALSGIRAVAAVWNVDMFTGVQSSEAQWDLEGKVSGEIQAIWDTEGRVWADLDAQWDVEAYVVSELDSTWDVTIDTGAQAVEAVWNNDGWVVSDFSGVWDLDGAVGSEIAAVWEDMAYTDAFSCVMRWDTQIDIPADNTMTYYFMDAANGEILGDLPFTDVSMSWVLSGSGTFEGSLKLSDPEIILRGGRNIRPGRTAIVADRGGVPIWSGIVWSKQFTGADSTVRITAGDFWTYIKRRLVFTNYSQKFTDVLWAAEDLIKMAVDPGVGGPERLTYQLSKPITVTDRPITLKYAITDMINIGEAIEGLAEAPGDTGIDFICKQYWVDEDVLIPFIKIGRPYVGRTYEETGTEFSFPGSVISYEETVDASALSNRIIAKGTDDGAKTKYTVLTRDDQLEVYPRYDSAISVDNKNLSVIESTAEYVSRRRAAPTRIATVTVRADLDPSPLDMEIGDWFLLRLEDAQSGDPQERMYRVGGMTYNPTDQTVEISPWVETDEYE